MMTLPATAPESRSDNERLAQRHGFAAPRLVEDRRWTSLTRNSPDGQRVPGVRQHLAPEHRETATS